ncbi:hypothetical protein [Desulfatitalea alkaliphila]|uniref:Uncharacterized protein n=1 Tax=Desulfatitalea alkaliphila TaxID=2929485 RepID=A0AA41R5F0_9BACT|nr:hypothetical protein [Desulfatitalea alkaliphila]MCJ8502659.1 hypothetical protein [Desulfatitalea alkaliphila]
MQLYWRIQQELSWMGETIGFTNPAFQRCYLRWLRKNALSVALAEGLRLDATILVPSMN